MKFLENLGGMLGGWVQANKNKQAAREAAQERDRLLNSLDWEPTLASENVPTYKKSESPIARSFLESLMTGDNPMMTAPGELNAKAVQGAQQRRTDQRWGTTDERVARQRQVMDETPWEVKTIPKAASGPSFVQNMTQRYPELSQVPNVSADEIETALSALGNDATGSQLASHVRRVRSDIARSHTPRK